MRYPSGLRPLQLGPSEPRPGPHPHAAWRRQRRGGRGGLGAPATAGQAGRSPAAMTTSSCSGKAVTRDAGWLPDRPRRSTWPTAPCSAPSTPTSRPRIPVPPKLRGPVGGAGRARRAVAAGGADRPRCTPRATSCPRCAATGSPSCRPPGATCCSAWSWASWSGGSTPSPRPSRPSPRPTTPPTATARSSTPCPCTTRPDGGGHRRAMRVLITGASGFAGAWLCRQCAEAGDEVRGACRAAGWCPTGAARAWRSTCATATR